MHWYIMPRGCAAPACKDRIALRSQYHHSATPSPRGLMYLDIGIRCAYRRHVNRRNNMTPEQTVSSTLELARDDPGLLLEVRRVEDRVVLLVGDAGWYRHNLPLWCTRW